MPTQVENLAIVCAQHPAVLVDRQWSPNPEFLQRLNSATNWFGRQDPSTTVLCSVGGQHNPNGSPSLSEVAFQNLLARDIPLESLVRPGDIADISGAVYSTNAEIRAASHLWHTLGKPQIHIFAGAQQVPRINIVIDHLQRRNPDFIPNIHFVKFHGAFHGQHPLLERALIKYSKIDPLFENRLGIVPVLLQTLRDPELQKSPKGFLKCWSEWGQFAE